MVNWERLKLIAKQVKPIQQGEVYVWYDNAGHYCDVIWLTASTFFTKTEHPEVMALVDSEDNLFGFKVATIPWFDDGEDGYTTVNLRRKLSSYNEGSIPKFDTEKQPDNPIVSGVVSIRYSKARHFLDLFWANGDFHYAETESEHILARVNNAGVLCGLKVVNIDQMSDDEQGFAHARLKALMPVETA